MRFDNSELSGAILKALSSQSTVLGQGEHCSLVPQRLASIGLVPGAQVRVLKLEIEDALNKEN